jgi:dihydroxy-acid dehydratase
MVMGTASTMACLAEALGFVFPAARASAVTANGCDSAKRPAGAPVEMATTDAASRLDLVTAASVSNAVTVLQALGGSTNAVIHLRRHGRTRGHPTRPGTQSIARARQRPVLADLKPIGAGFMEDFHHAGALPALMRRLRAHLDLDVRTAGTAARLVRGAR